MTRLLPEATDRRGARGPRLARRVDAIAPFRVMELVKRASALAAAGHPVIQMNIGEPDFTAPPPVVAALQRAATQGLSQYTPALGIEPLRRAIARDYGERHGLDISPSRIVVTAGASAALLLACCALVDVGDHVLMTDPSYPCNRHFVAAFDGVPALVPVGPESRFQMTRPLLESHWTPATAGALLATPANPTGTSIAFNELAGIVDAIRARGGFSLIDEIYLGLSYEGRPRSALELGDDVIVCNSFSKTFSMTGWRLGWLVVPESLVPAFEKLAQNLFICASALAQHAALDVPVTPDGAFYVWIDCARVSASSMSFAERLLEEAFVSIVPGHDFGTHQADRYLRLSYATALPQLEEAVRRMSRLIGS